MFLMARKIYSISGVIVLELLIACLYSLLLYFFGHFKYEMILRVIYHKGLRTLHLDKRLKSC